MPSGRLVVRGAGETTYAAIHLLPTISGDVNMDSTITFLIVVICLIIGVAVWTSWRDCKKYKNRVANLKSGDIFEYTGGHLDPWARDVVRFAKVIDVRDEWVKYMIVGADMKPFDWVEQAEATNVSLLENFLHLYTEYKGK